MENDVDGREESEKHVKIETREVWDRGMWVIYGNGDGT